MALLRAGITRIFLRHAYIWFRGSLRILHRLWLEVTGAIFFGLAAFAIPSLLREWRIYLAGGPAWKPLSAGVFMVMMISFGVYSFLKARRMR